MFAFIPPVFIDATISVSAAGQCRKLSTKRLPLGMILGLQFITALSCGYDKWMPAKE
jgi:hypothetical protein